jgi:hypothetical protein
VYANLKHILLAGQVKIIRVLQDLKLVVTLAKDVMREICYLVMIVKNVTKEIKKQNIIRNMKNGIVWQ